MNSFFFILLTLSLFPYVTEGTEISDNLSIPSWNAYVQEKAQPYTSASALLNSYWFSPQERNVPFTLLKSSMGEANRSSFNEAQIPLINISKTILQQTEEKEKEAQESIIRFLEDNYRTGTDYKTSMPQHNENSTKGKRISSEIK